MAPGASLTAVYESFLLTPQPGPAVCTTCFNLTEGYDRCFACSQYEPALAAMVPISYSVGHEQLHDALASYKRTEGAAARLRGIELSAALWRFLDRHEACLAHAAGMPGFEVVTTVPSGDQTRDQDHPLRWIVGQLVASTRARYERLLRRSTVEVSSREFSAQKYWASRLLHGETVLLIDDTWTTGASAQGAAAALMEAGAEAVAGLVIGRHVNREWGHNDERLRALPRFDWERCALCAAAGVRQVFGIEATAP